ncbi:hypothetical protein EUBHAL_00483 [Anaerobutyricum hallii DSM 3353]|uniref:Uncharacterized protein n=1 Tax=Anaerobutyricum hallii DSM 3353 TaxID=411469 RepID=C0ESW0_9FIRM|nr:hypothetical protein EUBHAL_00483 [Anaerobutyricum hallii DSM 3353]
MDIAEILYKFIITIFTAIKSSAFTEDFIAVLLMIRKFFLQYLIRK